MGFLSKLGNVAQDFTSAALPFAMTVGANALIPGGGGIASALSGTKLLAALGAGAKGFAGNEQQERLRKMQKEQNRNNAMANLINTLSPRANYQPNQAKTPKAGMLETVATGAGQGIDAFQMAMQAQQMAERAARQDKLLDMQMGVMQQDLQRQTGAAAANAGGKVPVRIDSYSKSNPVRNEIMDIEDTAPPPAVMAGFTEQMASNRAAENKVLMEQKKFLLEQMDTLSQIETRERNADISGQRLSIDRERLDREDERFGLDQKRFELEERRLQNTLATQRRQEVANMNAAEVATSERILQAQPSLKTADQVSSNYLKVKSLVKDLLSEDSKTRGAGMITLVNVFNRGFVDEGVAVRKEDIDNLRAAQSLIDSLAAEMQRYETGEALSQELVRNIDAATEQLYDAYIQAAQNSLQMRLNNSPGVTTEARDRIERFLLAPVLEVPSLRMLREEARRRGA